MQQFLVLFREEDGRTGTHEPEAIQQHRRNVQQWMSTLIAQKRWVDGYPLTLTGKVIRGPRPSAQPISEGPYAIGAEIVGGYIIMRAADLEEAATIIRDCPILDFDGFAEIRELLGGPDATASTSDATSPSSAFADSSDLPAKNKEIVRRFNSAFIQSGDIAAFHELIDPQVINHTAPPGMSKGADGIRDLILLFRKALPDLTVEIGDQVAEGDLVVTRKYFHATHTAPVMGIPPSGRKITIPVIDIIRLRDGKYVEHWGIRDMSDLQRQATS